MAVITKNKLGVEDILWQGTDTEKTEEQTRNNEIVDITKLDLPVIVDLIDNTSHPTLNRLPDFDYNISTKVFVLGKTSINDGYAGFFYYDPDSTATADGEDVVMPSSGIGRWLRITILNP